MRVLLSCLQSLQRHAIPAYDFWLTYFVEGCREAGIECVEVPGVDWAEGLAHQAGAGLELWRARTWETALDYARREHSRTPIDLFLGYLYPNQVEPMAIKELQRLGIPSVNFFCDNVREFRRIPDAYRPFTLHWVPELEALPLYRTAGLPCLHAPMPCWVPPSMRGNFGAETEPPTFIGSADILRRELIGRALERGADLMVRGPGWTAEPDGNAAGVPATSALGGVLRNQVALVRSQDWSALACKIGNRLRPLHPMPVPAARVRPAVFGSEYFRVSREALITIGINRVPTAHASLRRPLAYSRLRDIEAPMLGACYLTEWTSGLDALYESGAEIETYRTAEELAAKVEALKREPSRRRSLRERAQRRALAEHSVGRSLQRIAARLGVRASP